MNIDNIFYQKNNQKCIIRKPTINIIEQSRKSDYDNILLRYVGNNYDDHLLNFDDYISNKHNIHQKGCFYKIIDVTDNNIFYKDINNDDLITMIKHHDLRRFWLYKWKVKFEKHKIINLFCNSYGNFGNKTGEKIINLFKNSNNNSKVYIDVEAYYVSLSDRGNANNISAEHYKKLKPETKKKFRIFPGYISLFLPNTNNDNNIIIWRNNRKLDYPDLHIVFNEINRWYNPIYIGYSIDGLDQLTFGCPMIDILHVLRGINFLPPQWAAYTPKLSTLINFYLGSNLDKHHQCSKWYDNITEEQYKYCEVDVKILNEFMDFIESTVDESYNFNINNLIRYQNLYLNMLKLAKLEGKKDIWKLEFNDQIIQMLKYKQYISYFCKNISRLYCMYDKVRKDWILDEIKELIMIKRQYQLEYNYILIYKDYININNCIIKKEKDSFQQIINQKNYEEK